jgi:hypothetical protein
MGLLRKQTREYAMENILSMAQALALTEKW